MLRLINALFLSLTLALTGYSVAVARGQNPDLGTDMVICTGVGMIIITIGADGQPHQSTHICPDSISIFAASFATPIFPALSTPLQWRATHPANAREVPQEILSAPARGPPLVV